MKATIASSLSLVAALTLSARPGAAGTPPAPAPGSPAPAKTSAATTGQTAPSSPSALAAQIVSAASPDDAWKNVVGLKFTVAVTEKGATQSEWTYLWDVKSGRCRIDTRDKNGPRVFLLTDLNGDSSADAAYMERSSQMRGESGPEGSPEKKWVKTPQLPGRHAPSPGRERFRKDTFWLLAPLRLQDPTVKLVAEGTERVAGVTYDVVSLTMEKPGRIYRGALAYHLYVNPSTHRIDRWKVAYQDAALAAEKARYGVDPDAVSGPIEEPQLGTWVWSDYKKTGPFQLSMQRVQEEGDYTILYKDVTLLTEIPEEAFAPPAKGQGQGKKAKPTAGSGSAPTAGGTPTTDGGKTAPSVSSGAGGGAAPGSPSAGAKSGAAAPSAQPAAPAKPPAPGASSSTSG